MRRAHALSKAAGLSQLQALSAAWLAQMDYLRLDLQSMASNLVTALKLAEPNNHSARSRASLSRGAGLSHRRAIGFGVALVLAGSRACKRRRRRRHHQRADAQHGMDTCHKHAQCFAYGSSDRGEGEHALMAAESTWSFDKLVGATSLDSYVPLLHAQILAVKEKRPWHLRSTRSTCAQELSKVLND